MSKYILLLLILIQLNICIKKEVADTFYINPNLESEKEITIEEGKEFCIKISCMTKSYVLLNKNENEDSLHFQGTDSLEEHYENEYLGGRRSYLLYYFEAKSVTKESKILKFTDTYSYLRQKNPIPTLNVKINIINN